MGLNSTSSKLGLLPVRVSRTSFEKKMEKEYE